jgi:hypothetical protein
VVISDSVVTTVRDLCQAANALRVILIDFDGAAVAASGDVHAIPENLRRGLSGRALREAGSVIKLLEPLAASIHGGAPFLQVNAVGSTHLLVVAYDDAADPNLPAHCRRAAATMLDALRASLP